jgi:Helix-turn-helix
VTMDAASIVVLDDAPASLGLRSVRAPFSRTWAMSTTSRQIVVSATAQFVKDLPTGPVQRRRERLLLLSQDLSPATLDNVERVFDAVVVAEGSPEIAEILRAENRDELFLAASYDRMAGHVLLHRGDLRTLAVPLRSFTKAPHGPKPDPTKLRITDHGQTVALGAYEASADAILYENDPVYRARAKKRALAHDTSFGGALRRLRLQRGLLRTDFEPALTAKTVARLERSEVARPRGKTLAAIAKRLGVAPDEIAAH